MPFTIHIAQHGIRQRAHFVVLGNILHGKQRPADRTRCTGGRVKRCARGAVLDAPLNAVQIGMHIQVGAVLPAGKITNTPFPVLAVKLHDLAQHPLRHLCQIAH